MRSSITGTHGGAIRNHDSNTRNFPFTYTISSANTWERKSITLTLDTSGTWPSDNTLGLQLQFGLGVGTDFSGTADTWADGDKNSATGATTAMLSTSSATWYVTGIQLEVGSIMTPFEHLSFAEYKRKCLRYYYRYRKTIAYGMFVTTRSWSTTNADGIHSFPTSMRAAPTLSIDKTVNSTNFATQISVIAITEVESPNFNSAGRRCSSSNGSAFLQAGAAVIQTNGASTAIDCSFNFDAEMTT